MNGLATCGCGAAVDVRFDDGAPLAQLLQQDVAVDLRELSETTHLEHVSACLLDFIERLIALYVQLRPRSRPYEGANFN